MKIEELPGAWVIEAFKRGNVDIEVLTQKMPDEVDMMIHRIDIITPDSVNLLLLACAEFSDDSDFGLTMNERIDITMYGLLGYLILNSSTVKDLLYYIERYYSLLYSGGGFFKVTNTKDTFSVQFGTEQVPEVDSRHLTEWSLGFIPYFLSMSLKELSRPVKAEFAHAEPENCQKLHTVFGQNIVFNQSISQLIYNKNLLNKRINTVDPVMLKIIRQQADKSLQNYLKDDSFLKKIKGLLIERIESNAKADHIAKELGLSLSTFKRKMATEKIDFRKIKEAVKNELAQNMLSKSDAKISDIARKTGFSDQSAFTRFFIRCNKVTPQAFRKKGKELL